MKLDGATIPIEPRSVGGCMDLAVLFYRTHARQLLALTALFGVPACWLSHWIASHTESGLYLSTLLFFVSSPWLGAAVVAGAGPGVFGDPFTVRRALRLFFARFMTLTFLQLATRFAVAMLACAGLVPGLWLAVRYGFTSELLLLEQGSALDRRSGELMRGTAMTLLIRSVVILVFSICVVMSLFVLLDIFSGTALGLPILVGRQSSMLALDEWFDMLFLDPIAVTAVQAVMWLVYPLARLAWFFCYLDVRIRQECWDVELDFRIESRRLQ
jgi:hypothetical protein